MLVKLDESMKKFSFVVPITVFFVNVLGFWNEIVVVYNSLRLPLKVAELFLCFMIYSLIVSGIYKMATGESPDKMMVSFSPYIFLPLLSVFIDPRWSILILFLVSVLFFNRLDKKTILVILIRTPALFLFIWKISSWMR
ncbi:hypothetical protein [Thermotoga sp. SG1]|uniref:hypothetical protein n=1 Tax=Thermotoga sp. SG1 TaxID=126739 RepID=UPI001E5E8368|nr:hypothetical protein [Thermotoga sp. SG1]